MPAHPTIIGYEHFAETAVVARALFDLAGHRSGVYLVIDVERLAHPIGETSLLTLVATPSAVLYVGSATTLRDRVRALVRAVGGHPHAHGFGHRFRSMSSDASVEGLALVLHACDPGYYVEDFLLEEHVRLNQCKPMGNLRPARPTSRHNRPAWVKIDPHTLSGAIQVHHPLKSAGHRNEKP